MVRSIATKGARSFIVRGAGNCVLVDTGMERDPGDLERGLESLGIAPGDVALVVITHAHLDHYGALAAFRRATGVPVAAHVVEAPFIERGGQSPTVPRSGLGRFLNVLVKGQRNEPCPVDVLIEEELDLAPYGVDGRVLRTPGHTPGSLSVLTGDGEAIIGDLFRGKPGHRGFGLFCADEAAARGSLEKLIELRPRRIFPAHGPEAAFPELAEIRAAFGGGADKHG